jgi:hypothetical protein
MEGFPLRLFRGKTNLSERMTTTFYGFLLVNRSRFHTWRFGKCCETLGRGGHASGRDLSYASYENLKPVKKC